MNRKRYKIKLSVWQNLTRGYFLVIVAGSLLLMLPFASTEKTTYINALFTSTSATCVTGLVPYDSGTHWTTFGQIVIILLIQIGGLGFMTFVTMVYRIINRNMAMHGKIAMMQSAGIGKLSDLKGISKRILLGTAIFESGGAILLATRFVPMFGWGKGIYFAVWHSVSAFCNAGFDLMGTQGAKFVSFTGQATDPVITLTLAFLIIIGGLGFVVWSDIKDNGLKFSKYGVYTKVMLVSTVWLLIVSTALFMIFERNNPTYDGYTFGQKLLVAFFNATTPRTAGFNTTDLLSLSDSGYLLTVVLMFIGGGSGSTAGGVKVGTMAVILMGMVAAFKGKRDVTIGSRRIDSSAINQALAVFSSCLLIVVFSTITLCAIEPDEILSFKQLLFEVVSALGTVGLSMSATPLLSSVSKLIVILLMFTGRVGILTFALAFGKTATSDDVKKPVGNILIG